MKKVTIHKMLLFFILCSEFVLLQKIGFVKVEKIERMIITITTVRCWQSFRRDFPNWQRLPICNALQNCKSKRTNSLLRFLEQNRKSLISACPSFAIKKFFWNIFFYRINKVGINGRKTKKTERKGLSLSDIGFEKQRQTSCWSQMRFLRKQRTCSEFFSFLTD